MPLPVKFYIIAARMGFDLRRKARRYNYRGLTAGYKHINLLYQSLDNEVTYADIVDISLNGIRIMARGDLHPGNWIELSLNLPRNPVPLIITGEVIHTRKLSAAGSHTMAGLRLLSISSGDAVRLQTLLARIASGRPGGR